jgi:hypothetical protein
MSDRKTPLWPWIVALLIGLPVMYVASFGPACWLTADPRPIDPLGRRLRPSSGMIIYWPLGRLADRGPIFVASWLRWWMHVGAKERSTVIVPTDLDGNHFAMYYQ